MLVMPGWAAPTRRGRPGRSSRSRAPPKTRTSQLLMFGVARTGRLTISDGVTVARTSCVNQPERLGPRRGRPKPATTPWAIPDAHPRGRQARNAPRVSSGFRAAPVSARRKRSLRLAKDSLNETPRALARKLHRSSPALGRGGRRRDRWLRGASTWHVIKGSCLTDRRPNLMVLRPRDYAGLRRGSEGACAT